jgi:polysaccharide biosynthesis transport protein
MVTAIALAGSVLPTMLAEPQYVGKSILMLSSPGRGPEQDAMMVVAYAQMFNQLPTIERLRASNGLPDDVTFEARSIGSSPILEIEATATEPGEAQDVAALMSAAFRDDINFVRLRGAADTAQKLEEEYDGLLAVAPASPDGSANPLLLALRERIDAINTDTTNQLLDLQPRAGVEAIPTGMLFNVASGAVGGVLLGILSALTVARMSSRLRDSTDVIEKTGIKPLVEIPDGGTEARDVLREERIRALANQVHLQDLPKSTVLAVTDCAGARGARELAAALARLSAHQGYETVLVHADNFEPSLRQAGFNDALNDSALVHDLLVAGEAPALRILPAGSMIGDRYCRLTGDKVVGVLEELRTCADMIIVAAPSVMIASEAQIICATADFSMMVVSPDNTRSNDVTTAAQAFQDARVQVLGAVLMDESC